MNFKCYSEDTLETTEESIRLASSEICVTSDVLRETRLIAEDSVSMSRGISFNSRLTFRDMDVL